MIDIREHGRIFGGRKGGVEFVPQNFNPPITLDTSAGTNYERMAIGRTVALVRTNNQVQHTIDLATGTVIASTLSTGNIDMHCPLMDEHNDLIYGQTYDGYLGVYRYRAYDKNFNLVWENAESSLFANSVLTKDYLYVLSSGKINKISRETGQTVLSMTNSDFSSSAIAIGTNAEETKIVVVCYDGITNILDAATLTVEKRMTVYLLYTPYGVGIHNDILHVVYYSASDYRLYYIGYDFSGIGFTKNDALFYYELSGIVWQNSYIPGVVKTLKKGVMIATSTTTYITSYKKGDGNVTNTNLATNGVSGMALANNLHYIRYNKSIKKVDLYGKIR